MRTINMNGNNQNLTRSESDLDVESPLVGMNLWNDQVYREMDDQPVTFRDPLVELQSNIEILADLQNRFSFMMREVKYLIKS